MSSQIPTGKLPADLLRGLLRKHSPCDPRVLVEPGVGQDAAIVEVGDRCLVATTDPVTFATDEIGWYAVHVNANDVACCGAAPRWFLATLLLPEHWTTPELAESIFAQLADACRDLNVSLCGGHTEVTGGLDRPIVVGQMLGEVDRDQYVTSGGAQIGDALILTKGIAVEGTAIIAREKRESLQAVVAEDLLDRCANMLHAPGISVVKDARVALEAGGVHALHDPTEGGTATGLCELAEASGVGLAVDRERLPVLPDCDALCRHFALDPLGLIASGSLLIAAEQERAAAMVDRLRAAGTAATEIGEVVAPERGRILRSPTGEETSLPVFDRDEITRLFEAV